MKPPLFVRELTTEERAGLEAALRSPDAFALRRAQILLQSAEGQRPARIAASLRCASQTVRNALRAFDAEGLACLQPGSSRPKSARPAFEAEGLERLRAILHQSPRAFGKGRSAWTLSLLAEAAHEQGLTPTALSHETIRKAVHRLGYGWKRAKNWITSPDPAYARKKGRSAD